MNRYEKRILKFNRKIVRCTLCVFSLLVIVVYATPPDSTFNGNIRGLKDKVAANTNTNQKKHINFRINEYNSSLYSEYFAEKLIHADRKYTNDKNMHVSSSNPSKKNESISGTNTYLKNADVLHKNKPIDVCTANTSENRFPISSSAENTNISGQESSVSETVVSTKKEKYIQIDEERISNISVWNYINMIPYGIMMYSDLRAEKYFDEALEVYKAEIEKLLIPQQAKQQVELIKHQLIKYVSKNWPQKYLISYKRNSFFTDQNKPKKTLGDLYITNDLLDATSLVHAPFVKNGFCLSTVENRNISLNRALDLIFSIWEVFSDLTTIDENFFCDTLKGLKFENDLTYEENLYILIQIRSIMKIALELEKLEKENVSQRRQAFLNTENFKNVYETLAYILDKNPVKKDIEREAAACNHMLSSMEKIYERIYSALITFYENLPIFYIDNTVKKPYRFLGKNIITKRCYKTYEIPMKNITDSYNTPTKPEIFPKKGTLFDHKCVLNPRPTEHFHVYYVDNEQHTHRRVCIPYYYDKLNNKICIHTVRDIIKHLVSVFNIDTKKGKIYPYYTPEKSNSWSYVRREDLNNFFIKGNHNYHFVFYYIEEDFFDDKLTFVQFHHKTTEEEIHIPLFLNSLMRDAFKIAPFTQLNKEHTFLVSMDFENITPDKYAVDDTALIISPNKNYVTYYKTLTIYPNDDLSIGIGYYTMGLQYVTLHNTNMTLIKWKERIPTSPHDHAYYIYETLISVYTQKNLNPNTETPELIDLPLFTTVGRQIHQVHTVLMKEFKYGTKPYITAAIPSGPYKKTNCSSLCNLNKKLFVSAESTPLFLTSNAQYLGIHARIFRTIFPQDLKFYSTS